MFGKEYELNEAAEQAKCHYRIAPQTITDENKDEQYDCYEVVDREFALAVPDMAPEDAFAVVEDEGFEAIPQGELNRESVKEFVGYFEERPAFYESEPPQNRYETIPRGNGEEFLAYHDRDYHDVEDAVWYPEREAAVIQYNIVDNAGRINRHMWERDGLSTTERQILLEGADVTEDEELTREEVAEIIDQNSPIYPREADIVSCWVYDITDYQQIVRELGPDEVTYDSVAQSTYNFRDRQKAVAWSVLHVWKHVPSDHLPDKAEAILKQVDTENVRDPDFYAPGKGRGKK